MKITSIGAFALLLTSMPAANASAGPDPAHCGLGVYQLPDGGVVDVAPSAGNTLRWRRFDGTTGALTPHDGVWSSTAGWTGKPDGLAVRFDCEHQSMQFGAATARRIPLLVTESRFQADDVPLAGRLVLPPGRGRVPIVILVHGSENDSARDTYAMQRLLPARGVGVYVYDKRGTGESGGRYTQDFERLAADATQALRDARRLAGRRAGRVGYLGTSQGGWVAPLAARRAPVDFLIVAYGLAVSVIDEDIEVIELEMKLKGHGPVEIAKALEVAKAGHVVFESGFEQGFAHFAALRARYRQEPWYRDLHGNFTHLLLGLEESQLADTARTYDWHTPFRYDPMPTLRALNTPQLWVLGADDLAAPSGETARRLAGLIDSGKPIVVAMFPGAEHGMTEYEIAPDGTRASTRFAPGYFDILADYARGKLATTYGRASITR